MEINSKAPVRNKKDLAKSLGISRQSLYYHPKMAIKDLELKTKIEGVMTLHQSYEHKRIAKEMEPIRKGS